MSATTDFEVRFGGGFLRCRTLGEGRPVMFMNGIGASLDLLDPFVAEMEDSQLILWDPPGIGGSPVPMRPPSIPHVARAALRVLDHVGLQQVDVVGLSWGGFVAQQMALRHSRRVRRLVLAATGLGFGSRIGDLRVMPMMLSNKRFRSPAYLKEIAPAIYGGDILDQPDLLDTHSHLRHEHAPSIPAYWWQALAGARWTSIGRLRRIRQPTLIMGADDDPIAHIANSHRLARGIPNSHLEIIPNGGHLFLLTRPEESARLIEEFLAEVDVDPGGASRAAVPPPDGEEVVS